MLSTLALTFERGEDGAQRGSGDAWIGAETPANVAVAVDRLEVRDGPFVRALADGVLGVVEHVEIAAD